MDNVLKRLELARTGSFGSDGAEITLADLQEILETFDGKCPVSLGHYMTKQDWWPSWGNVETIDLVIDENGVDATLLGDVSLAPILAEAIDEGFYTGWSISMPRRASDNKRYLHHLAMLGSVPPKIRDLKVLATASEKPENAIEVTDEGMSFADQAFYSRSDFRKPDPPAAAPDFSDPQIEKKEARARSIYKDGIRAKVIARIGSRWPAGKQGQLADFADKLVEAHDWEFADQKGKSLVDFFISLVETMAQTPAPKPGKMTFADPAPGQTEIIDRANMAREF